MSSDPFVPDPDDDAGIDDAPEFELACLYDDPSNPRELTVFSPADHRMATEWLTVDRSVTVSLADVR
jgi:hypothetical protein